MSLVHIDLGERSYDVAIGRGLASGFVAGLRDLGEVVLVTDAAVAELPWFLDLEKRFRRSAKRLIVLAVPSGESSKSLEQCADLFSALASENFSRECLIVAVGGGVVGDLAGFVASAYLRGVRFVQVPTTLLAAVDSSVGGKTGVNLPEGKNLVGAFYQPESVLIDLDFLETLPDREFSAGMAEVIKYGVIRDPGLFEEVSDGRPGDLAAVIARCVEIKGGIVSRDERETLGERALLNFGHTLGHAIEQSSGYGTLLHGEAVAVGMAAAGYLSTKVLGFPESGQKRMISALRASNLPTQVKGLDYDRLAAVMARDKKAVAARPKWVLARSIGDSQAGFDVPDELVREAVDYCSGKKAQISV